MLNYVFFCVPDPEQFMYIICIKEQTQRMKRLLNEYTPKLLRTAALLGNNGICNFFPVWVGWVQLRSLP